MLDRPLVSFSPATVHYAALAEPGRFELYRKREIRLSHFVKLNGVDFHRIDLDLREHDERSDLLPAVGVTCRVASDAWDAMIRAVKRLSPASARGLDALELLRIHAVQPVFNGPGFETLALEKDAFGLAMRIFGYRDLSRLGRWEAAQTDQFAPFLRGLRWGEDHMVSFDARRFPGWEPIRDYVVGIEFSSTKRNEKLTVVNANRTSIERTLGVDLLYYHHRYGSYVLVQYKRMTSEGHTDGLGYRPVGRAHEEEVRRMMTFLANHPDGVTVSHLDAYRLNSGPFYFKLCPSADFRPRSTDLLEGMYIPLDYWTILCASPNVVGPRGGRRITYDNVGRFMSNRLFPGLVSRGWIGSRGPLTNALALALSGVYADRSVTVALSQRLDSQAGAGRTRAHRHAG